MTIADMARLHESTLRAMNVRNYLLRKARQLETELDLTNTELAQAENVFGQLQARCAEVAAPKLPKE